MREEGRHGPQLAASLLDARELARYASEAPLLEGTPESPATWLFEPESFAPLAKLVDDERYSIITDHLGTPRAMYDAHGQEAWSAETDTYGQLQACAARDGLVRFGFWGSMRMPRRGSIITGFDIMTRRVGDVRQDPIGLTGGVRPLPGTHLDRLGGPHGRFVSPAGMPMAMRELPHDADLSQYRAFEVLKPLIVQSGQIAPAFGKIGPGIQHVLPQPASELVSNGFLRVLRGP
jgi:Tuberculosis necrotizing toxin/RHS protein